jgi:hypothetical protein
MDTLELREPNKVNRLASDSEVWRKLGCLGCACKLDKPYQCFGAVSSLAKNGRLYCRRDAYYYTISEILKGDFTKQPQPTDLPLCDMLKILE